MLVIGIAGGSGSGKTTVVKAITDKLSEDKVVVIPQDSYYKDSSDLSDEEKRNHNFTGGKATSPNAQQRIYQNRRSMSALT